jgi:hypothetical protein
LSTRVKPNRSVVESSGYSATAVAVLPEEDRAEFEKLHRNLIVEFYSSGVLEFRIVANLARLIWRKEHLAKSLREPIMQR